MVKWWVVSSGFEKKTLKIAQQKMIENQKDTLELEMEQIFAWQRETVYC